MAMNVSVWAKGGKLRYYLFKKKIYKVYCTVFVNKYFAILNCTRRMSIPMAWSVSY